MKEQNKPSGNIYSANDALDINELASLNEDISLEFIEQLQNQVAQNATDFSEKTQTVSATQPDDTELFEEVQADENSAEQKVQFDESIDDNFVNKYKAKLSKQEAIGEEEEETVQMPKHTNQEAEPESIKPEATAKPKIEPELKEALPEEIENLTNGNIIERPAVQEQIDYNESLDFVDDNINYSKYVIYIEPENKPYMDSLTVKERKNLINRILREQDSIALTKRRFWLIQTVIKHSIVAIITVSLAIPALYWLINTSLETSINNHKRSEKIFKTLYREKGKIRAKVQH